MSIAELNSAAWIQSEDTLEYCPSWADDDEPGARHLHRGGDGDPLADEGHVGEAALLRPVEVLVHAQASGVVTTAIEVLAGS